MHRTEGRNNDGGLYTEGPPPTTITAAAMNSLQEELASVIEYSGQSLLTAGTDTQNQLLAAVMLISLRISQALKIGELIYATNETEAAAFIASGALELDGSVVTSANYPYLALARPSWVAAGNITLPNLANRVLRVKGADTGNAGTTQEDAMQRITGYIEAASNNSSELGLFGSVSPTISGVFSLDGTTQSINQVAGTTVAAGQRGFNFDSADSTSPNAAKTDDDETRVKAYIVRAFVIADGYFD